MPTLADPPLLPLRLLLSNKGQQSLVTALLQGIPPLSGLPILISFHRELSRYRGKLLLLDRTRGQAVYAASFIRERQIILERELLSDHDSLRLILVHELFHFVWPRLSNARRRAYSDLIACEIAAKARGELGESADVAKSWLCLRDSETRTKGWREYVCESFCDTAAWLYASKPDQAVFTLAHRYRRRRRVWWETVFAQHILC